MIAHALCPHIRSLWADVTTYSSMDKEPILGLLGHLPGWDDILIRLMAKDRLPAVVCGS